MGFFVFDNKWEKRRVLFFVHITHPIIDFQALLIAFHALSLYIKYITIDTGILLGELTSTYYSS